MPPKAIGPPARRGRTALRAATARLALRGRMHDLANGPMRDPARARSLEVVPIKGPKAVPVRGPKAVPARGPSRAGIRAPTQVRVHVRMSARTVHLGQTGRNGPTRNPRQIRSLLPRVRR